MPKPKNKVSDEKSENSSLNDGGVSSDTSSVEIATMDNTDSTRVDVPKAASNGIEVVATRSGFFAQQRKVEGDKFFVSKFEQLGEWMKCLDTEMEKKRVAFFKEKKKARK